MSILEIFILAIGLSMDAFAVSIGKGITIKKLSLKKVVLIAFVFGLFQALMPLIGYFFGMSFRSVFIKIDHYIAFILLSYIGLEMIKSSRKSEENQEKTTDLKIGNLFLLGIATSIDAFVVGLTFAFLEVNIILSISMIGIITFFVCSIGVLLGQKIGEIYGKMAELFGGILLIFLGIKILITHLFFL